MSDFDGLVRNDKTPEPTPASATSSGSKSTKKGGGIAEALGAEDIGSLARKFDPDVGRQYAYCPVTAASATLWLGVASGRLTG